MRRRRCENEAEEGGEKFEGYERGNLEKEGKCRGILRERMEIEEERKRLTMNEDWTEKNGVEGNEIKTQEKEINQGRRKM